MWLVQIKITGLEPNKKKKKVIIFEQKFNVGDYYVKKTINFRIKKKSGVHLHSRKLLGH